VYSAGDFLKPNDFGATAVSGFFFERVARVDDHRSQIADAIVINARMFCANDDAIGIFYQIVGQFLIVKRIASADRISVIERHFRHETIVINDVRAL
jgi:hypothetical protein